MKVVTNTELVESRAKWGKRIAPVTLIFLVGGLITNFLSINNPEYFRMTLILLFIGFISAIFSSNLVNNWVREPRSDQILAQLLKKFGNDYLLFNYTTRFITFCSRPMRFTLSPSKSTMAPLPSMDVEFLASFNGNV